MVTNLEHEIEEITHLLDDLHHWVRSRQRKGHDATNLEAIVSKLEAYRELISRMRASGVYEMG